LALIALIPKVSTTAWRCALFFLLLGAPTGRAAKRMTECGAFTS
jgi:hypothetical protein